MKKGLKIAAITVGVIIILMFLLPFAFQGKIADIVKTEGNKMLNAQGPEDYAEYVKELQHVASEEVVGIALCWDTAYYPYRTDKYEGWTNYPGWGVINCETWYHLRPIA